MSESAAGWLQLAAVIAALAACHKPLGDYLARVFTSERHLRVERGLYRVAGIDPKADQRWPVYTLSLVAFSAVSVLALYALLRAQTLLPLSGGRPGVPADGAFNTAVSFVTNTNWQWYAGESTLGNLAQMAGLAVQNFLSAAVGLAVAVALIRGFLRTRTDRLGNFWVDLTHATVRILLPLAALAALVLLAGGVVQSFAHSQDVATVAGGSQTLPLGPVASQEAIKELGTNGGGFFNANSAHPYENPNPFTDAFEVFLLLLVPTALPRTFGTMINDRRQGYAVLAAMTVMFAGVLALTTASEVSRPDPVPAATGQALEGKEVRFGVPASTLFATATTGTSTGAVNASHDSLTSYAGGAVIMNMLLGEVAPGGVGTGLYGILVLALLAVFLAGLMVGRTPEYLGKKIGRREMTLVSLTILVMPLAVLAGTGLAIATETGRAGILNSGPHGQSEVLYAYASAGNNNGSAFAGLTVATPFYNVTLALAMLLGRFLPILLVLALAGSLAQQQHTPETAGTLPTHRPLFVGLLVGVAVGVAALTFVPALALGPLAEGLA